MCRGLGMRRKSVHLHSDTSTPIPPISHHTHITHLLKSLKKTPRFDKKTQPGVVSRASPTHARSFPSAGRLRPRTADERKREDAHAAALRLRDSKKAESSQVLLSVRTIRQASNKHLRNRNAGRSLQGAGTPDSGRPKTPRKRLKRGTFEGAFKLVNSRAMPERRFSPLTGRSVRVF